MTNLEVIALAFEQFNNADYPACEKTLFRIRNNFTIESDELDISIVAEIARTDFKSEPRVVIYFKAHEAYATDFITGVEFYCQGHCHIDAEGVHSLTANGGKKADYWRKTAAKLFKSWLKTEFGLIGGV
jgi:hypothetical protein